MPKSQSNTNRGSSLPDLEIEAGFNLNKSTENINKEIDREDTSIEATHENCDTTIEIREGGLRDLIMGRTEKTEIDCEPDEIEHQSSSESFFPEENEQPEIAEESRESEESFWESQSESFLESESDREVESEFESTFC